ncbi:2-dehydropantoate 2-reductase [Mesobacillus subterraneus]|uniref:ketopantoate reductase family protein n=1 Tax=Mesobacillus subterraneus TaxID=285983 RepID=UPI00203F135F|nr:2-dehydropantoate 2-reductase [Mesobacillus subterraneus]MCM3666256.1 2-dehydropantoate 2-reductase [Mesobacillus subterraneus]MCM3685255.1 2-dehydropantoate 2-reductase [Mesobacillus subterraneus]
MEITVIGAGAIGGVLGAHLVRAGNKVTFCDKDQEHVHAMNSRGLRIEGPDETFTVECDAYTPEQLVKKKPALDAVFLSVKAQHTKEALKPFLHLIEEETKVVSFQNGLCENEIASLIGRDKTIGCFVNFSADYLEPGRILYGGVAALYLGELDGQISQRVKDLQKILQCWGPAQVTDNIWGYLWGKMSYAGLLYATALVDETMAAVVRKMELRETLMELCSEILEVADKEGVKPIGFDDWVPELVYPRVTRNQSILDQQLEKLAQRMAANKKTKSGIWRDLAVRKRKTEIDSQLVPILEIGAHHRIPMPLTGLLVSLIKEIETGTIQMDWDHLYKLKEQYESGEKYAFKP